MKLDPDTARRFSRVALANVVTEYPNKLDHLMQGPADAETPSRLHPVFYGSYDWHSSVHMHWTLVTLRASCPDLPERDEITAVLDRHFTVERIAVERAYLDRPASRSFERPYGWAWLLKLAAALGESAADDLDALRWHDTLAPLATAFVARFIDWMPKAVYPTRSGMHGNTAFALLLALDHARARGDPDFEALLVDRARAWYGDDRDYPVAYEVGSEDFLSGGLVEAALMRRVLDAPGFASWWAGFVPRGVLPRAWLHPVEVSDRSDPRIAHLDGLNLSRAWCWRLIADGLPAASHATIVAAVDAHLAASLPHAAQGHYVGTHWLASFALLALGTVSASPAHPSAPGPDRA